MLRNFRKADGTFGLASILDNSTPSIQLDGNETKVYAASEIPGIDVKALAYFSASIFWRGSLYGWNDDGSVPVPLGPYAESFREYLLGEASFPENVALLIAKRDGGEVSSLTSTPVGKRLGLVRTYKFAMPGIAIAIAVGKGLTPTMRRLCFAHGKGNPIASTPLLEAIIQADAVKKLQSHLAPPSKRSTRW